MNNIVSVKGNFTPDFIESSLNDILKKYSIDDLNSKLNLYVEIDKTTNQYIYHWNEIKDLFSRDPNDLTDSNNAKEITNRIDLGMVETTIVVKYDHVEYVNDGTEIKTEKNCDKNQCTVSSNYIYDPDTLRDQYNSKMSTVITSDTAGDFHEKTVNNARNNVYKLNDKGFEELEKQLDEYLKTGTIDEGSLLANYICEWKDD